MLHTTTPAGRPSIAYVGCFTSRGRNGTGTGISVYAVGRGWSEWTLTQHLDIVNPSFLAFGREKKFLYSAHADEDFVTAFGIDDATGHLSELNRQRTGGMNTVDLIVAPSNRFLICANYSSGNLTVIRLLADGSLGVQTDIVGLTGSLGPHKTQQTVPHPHNVLFDRSGRFLLIPDKGLDAVNVYRLDNSAGKLIPVSCVATRPGAGPRRMVFDLSNTRAYVLNELDSTVTSSP